MGDEELVALAQRLQEMCLGHGWTVATAESCTGGLVGHLLTEVPGSSGYVLGAIVAYADEVKASLLGVPGETLQAHGAVSAQVALAMASGVRRAIGSDIGVSVTGIAGPDGGSETKPVGLTYVGIAGPRDSEVRRHVWTGDRHENKVRSARAALELALEVLGEGGGDLGAEASEPAGQP